MSEDDITPIESGKKKTPVSMSVLDQLSPEARKAFWDDTFQKLTESDRFLAFVDSNYSIVVSVDDEKKIRETLVIEKPISVGPPLTDDQRFKLHVACMRSGTKEPITLLNNILKVLGQAPQSLIASADDAALKRAVAEADAQDKLKKGLDD